MDHLQKNRERIQKFKETGDPRHIYRNELDKTCFQHDMVYWDFKDLARRTVSHKFSRDKALNMAKNLKYYGYQRGLASMVYKLFDKKPAGSGITTLENQITQNERLLDLSMQQLAEELHKLIVRKTKKRTVYSSFKDSIWGAELADIQLLSMFSKGIRFLFCVILTFTTNMHRWKVQKV